MSDPDMSEAKRRDESGTRHPLLIVVSGMPASGKTTLARTLGKNLGIPVIEKDAIKETLYDALGIGDVAWSQKLGVASYDLILAIAHSLLSANASLIAEANFFGGMEPMFASLPPHRPVQVHCTAPLDVLVERYTNRPPRHPGHLDTERVGELRARHASGLNGPLELEGELIEVDTTTGSVERLAEAVLARLG
jgi:predicted kinase